MTLNNRQLTTAELRLFARDFGKDPGVRFGQAVSSTIPAWIRSRGFGLGSVARGFFGLQKRASALVVGAGSVPRSSDLPLRRARCKRGPASPMSSRRAGPSAPCPDRSTLLAHPFELIRPIRPSPIGPISLDQKHTPIANPSPGHSSTPKFRPKRPNKSAAVMPPSP